MVLYLHNRGLYSNVMAKKKGFFKRVLRGILIGGGSVLSLLCPPAGGAIITAGMAIGSGMTAAGELITVNESRERSNTIDSVTGKVQTWLQKIGLTQGVNVQTPVGSFPAITLPGVLLIVGILSFVFILFRRK